MSVPSRTMAMVALSASQAVTVQGQNGLAGMLARILPMVRGELRRRIIDISIVLLAIMVASPQTRNSILGNLRDVLRAIVRYITLAGRPTLRKDFLNAAGKGKGNKVDFTEGVAALSSISASADAHFEDLGAALPHWLKETLRREGLGKMKPIQRAALPLALQGRDIVAIAPTGSGKTLAFLVPAIVHILGQQVQPKRINDGPVALVLAPTRELVIQIAEVADKLMRGSRPNGGKAGGKGSSGSDGGLCSTALYGGTRRIDQLQTLQRQRSTHMFIATPGRLLDFLRQGAFTLKLVSFFVLDEGDRMLDFGFEPDVTSISNEIRSDRHMLFFSATWPPAVQQVAQRLCSSGEIVEKVWIKNPQAQVSNGELDGSEREENVEDAGGFSLPPREIVQHVEVIKPTWKSWDANGSMQVKLPLLLNHLEAALGTDYSKPPLGKALIFVKTRVLAEELGTMVADYFGLERCGVMHGLRKQEQRESTLKAFREGQISALVTTDVLGRGVDIPDVTHVIIFDFPGDIETYVHRVGRTGRNGRPGLSVAFFEPQPWAPDMAKELADVLHACGQTIPEPLAREVERFGGGSNGARTTRYAPPVTSDESFKKEAPPLAEKGNPKQASADELGEWDARGARCWSYSANDGASEQGRLELRTGGLLRTTWGWGEWALVEPENEQLTAAIAEAEAAAGKGSPPRRNLSISWAGETDVVRLNTNDGLNFELVTRSGRPAEAFRKKTMGCALLALSEL